jgi:hypothetical protein
VCELGPERHSHRSALRLATVRARSDACRRADAGRHRRADWPPSAARTWRRRRARRQRGHGTAPFAAPAHRPRTRLSRPAMRPHYAPPMWVRAGQSCSRRTRPHLPGAVGPRPRRPILARGVESAAWTVDPLGTARGHRCRSDRCGVWRRNPCPRATRSVARVGGDSDHPGPSEVAPFARHSSNSVTIRRRRCTGLARPAASRTVSR